MAQARNPGHSLAAQPAAIAVVVLSLGLHHSAVAQQPCNPVIDGTYCAEQMPRPRTLSPSPRVTVTPIQDIATAMSVGQDAPGTLAGISLYSGGTTCIGLLRRGNCN